MSIKRFEDMNAVALDVFREIGSIGVGNAATALSEVLGVRVRMKLPKVSIEGYDEAISSMGHPEDMVAAVLVEMGGDIKGIMLYMLKLDFINAILARLVGKYIEDFSQIVGFCPGRDRKYYYLILCECDYEAGRVGGTVVCTLCVS